VDIGARGERAVVAFTTEEPERQVSDTFHDSVYLKRMLEICCMVCDTQYISTQIAGVDGFCRRIGGFLSWA
jgi:hypothetical protein